MPNTKRMLLIGGLLATMPLWIARGATMDDDPFLGEWSLRVTPDADAANEGQDTFGEAVLFHRNEFSAAVFAGMGFAPAAYSVGEVDGVTVFVATLTSTDRGTLTWTGRVTRGDLVGTLAWARPEGVTYRYEVVGVRPDEMR